MIASLLLIPALLMLPQGGDGEARSGVSDRDLAKMGKEIDAFFTALDEDDRKNQLEALGKLETAMSKAGKKAKADLSMLAYTGDWDYALEVAKKPDRSLSSDFGKGFFRHVFADPWDRDGRRVVSLLSVPAGVKSGEIMPAIVCLKSSLGLTGKDLDDGLSEMATQAFGALLENFIVLIPIGLEKGSGRKAESLETEGSWSADDNMYVLFTAYRTLLEQLPFDRTRVILDGWGEAGIDALQLAGTTPFFSGVLLRSSPVDSPAVIYSNLAEIPVMYLQGSADSAPESLEALTESEGVSVEVLQVEGESMAPAADSLVKVQEWLGARQKDPNPADFSYKLGDVRFGSVNWCTATVINRRVTAKPDDADFPSVKVHVAPGSNKVDIETVNVFEMIIFLNDEIVDMDKPVTIAVNGEVMVKDKIYKRSLRDLLETRFFNNSGDYGLYTASERIEGMDANLPSKD
ncbi:MAG: hypothetical protein P8N09_05945 [Planctomycetota bacterium]|jgi:hypothetical protein|nr:hypothetical protein [Planctomycetota bacterium]